MIFDPQAQLDFAVDWTAWLQSGETITDATWTIPTGLTAVSGKPAAIVGGKAVVWVQGGTEGSRYLLTVHITTSAGRQDDRSIQLDCRQR